LWIDVNEEMSLRKSTKIARLGINPVGGHMTQQERNLLATKSMQMIKPIENVYVKKLVRRIYEQSTYLHSWNRPRGVGNDGAK
jgi:hypothetical protein